MKDWFDIGAPARAAFFALLPILGVAGLEFAAMLGMAGVLSVRPSLFREVLENKPLSLAALALFVAWTAVTALWSPVQDWQAAKLAATVLTGLCFAWGAARPATRRLTRAAAIAAFVVLSLLLAVEALWQLPLNRARQPGTELLDLASAPAQGAVILLGIGWGIAAGALADERPRLGWATLAICGLATSQFGQRADLAAFGAGLGAFALGLAAPRFALVAVSGLLAVWMLAAPFATPVLLAQTDLAERLPFSLAHRIGIWEYVCNRIGESPWIGHGLDASSAVDDKIMVQGKESSAISLHPHSASLQIWFETGAVGALLAAAALLTAGWRLSSALADNRAAAAAVCGALASYGLLANVSWEAWHEWRQAAMLLCASVIAAFAPQTDYAAASWHMANRAHKKR